ncbi:methyltransferase [Methanococcoides sp. AM1]|uniref:methyltransferase n=1 Tax=Methanococcoides sp. AM1 TaxID=1201011 RepID=UPI0010846102|nr:methyltransferase [Methanococcoides sp. AM1]
MKVLDTIPEISSEPLDRIVKGCEAFHILLIALDFDLFDMLEESKTAEQISSEICTDASLTGKFLNTLVALQFLSKENDKYMNTKLASTFLVKDSPFYQGNLLRFSGRNSDKRSMLNSILKGDVPEANKGRFEDVFDSSFILAMAEGSMKGSLHQTMKEVSTLPEFEKARTLLDLGGEHGLYAIAFAEMNPELEATVFDLPHVTGVTKEFIERYDMNDKVGIIGGNFFEDEIGSGYDIVFSSDVFYRKSDVLAGVLKKVYNALNNKGSIVFKHWILNDERTAPPTSVLFDLNLSLRGDMHHIYTENECVELLENAQFSNVRVLDISSQTSPSMLIIGDKEV